MRSAAHPQAAGGSCLLSIALALRNGRSCRRWPSRFLEECGSEAIRCCHQGNNILMSGPPGAGKSMLAQRLPSILPPLQPRELLEVSMIPSVAGQLANGALSNCRPFRAPHHSASMAALVGGGLNARPGEVSLAHHGVL